MLLPKLSTVSLIFGHDTRTTYIQYHCVHYATFRLLIQNSASLAPLFEVYVYLSMLFIVELTCLVRCAGQLRNNMDKRHRLGNTGASDSERGSFDRG